MQAILWVVQHHFVCRLAACAQQYLKLQALHSAQTHPALCSLVASAAVMQSPDHAVHINQVRVGRQVQAVLGWRPFVACRAEMVSRYMHLIMCTSCALCAHDISVLFLSCAVSGWCVCWSALGSLVLALSCAHVQGHEWVAALCKTWGWIAGFWFRLLGHNILDSLLTGAGVGDSYANWIDTACLKHDTG